MTTPQQRGTTNNRKGKTAEQTLARYLKNNGWPHAQRAIRTGWKNHTTHSPDPGDLTGTPGLTWQIKNTTTEPTDTTIHKQLTTTATQTTTAGNDHGILIHKRPHKANPHHWWAWLTTRDLLALHHPHHTPTNPTLDTPIRLKLGDLIPQLHHAGYGEPPQTHTH